MGKALELFSKFGKHIINLRFSHSGIAVKTDEPDNIVLTFEGVCEEETDQIRQLAFSHMSESFKGQAFIAHTNLTADDIHVRCGIQVSLGPVIRAVKLRPLRLGLKT